jgi:hypothetical protein
MPDVTGQLINPQVVEIWVNGPEGANRLYLCSGNVNTGVAPSQANQTMHETFTFLVGPEFARQEVVRATCAAGISGYYVSGQQFAYGNATVLSTDADWDDESGKVQVQIDVETYGPWGIRGFHYNVMILAQQPEQ